MLPRKSRNAYVHRGRFWLVVTFLILRAVDCVGYLACYSAHKKVVIAAIIDSIFLSSVLLTGVWFRQLWARYMIITLLGIWMALGLTFTGFLQEFFGAKYLFVMVCGYFGYVTAISILITTPSLQKLTSRSFG